MFNEVHSIHGHTLLLITKPSLQATALLQHLKQSLAVTGKLHNIQRSLDDISASCIVLLDMMEADKKNYPLLARQFESEKQQYQDVIVEYSRRLSLP